MQAFIRDTVFASSSGSVGSQLTRPANPHISQSPSSSNRYSTGVRQVSPPSSTLHCIGNPHGRPILSLYTTFPPRGEIIATSTVSCLGQHCEPLHKAISGLLSVRACEAEATQPEVLLHAARVTHASCVALRCTRVRFNCRISGNKCGTCFSARRLLFPIDSTIVAFTLYCARFIKLQ